MLRSSLARQTRTNTQETTGCVRGHLEQPKHKRAVSTAPRLGTFTQHVWKSSETQSRNLPLQTRSVIAPRGGTWFKKLVIWNETHMALKWEFCWDDADDPCVLQVFRGVWDKCENGWIQPYPNLLEGELFGSLAWFAFICVERYRWLWQVRRGRALMWSLILSVFRKVWTSSLGRPRPGSLSFSTGLQMRHMRLSTPQNAF